MAPNSSEARPDGGLEPSSTGRSGWAASMDYLEKVVKLASVLAVFGYVSLRAHVNRLGIPFTSSLDLEGYLRETYSVMASLLDAILMTSIVALVFLIMGTVSVLIPRLAAPSWSLRAGGRIERAFDSLRISPWTPAVALLVLLCFYLWLISRVSQYWTASAIAVGSLDLAKLSPLEDSAPYLLLIWVCIAGYVLHWIAVSGRKIRTPIPGTVQEAAPGSLHGLLWRAFGVFLILVALHIPLLDGLSRRDAVFTQAMIFGDAKGVPAVCGLIVLTTSSTVEVWQAKNGIGVVQMIPTGRIARIVAAAPADLLALARTAAKDRSTTSPQCIDGESFDSRSEKQQTGATETKP